MQIVIFGLSISSSWGNGHATLWRGLCKELIRRGHHIVFFERDVPYYASHRDLSAIDGGHLLLYPDWSSVTRAARIAVADADVTIVTSYCVDALAATDLILDSNSSLKVFYDLDTPVTLAKLNEGAAVPYIGPGGLEGFDLVLSYTGGLALAALKSQLGARRVAPLYGSVDPDVHQPVPPVSLFRADLSYLGTYSDDRQARLAELFLEPARNLPARRFALGGSLYPMSFPWLPNIFYFSHVAPCDHPAFYSSARLTLNVTRGPMAEMGYCPSGRLFEAAACGTPILSDAWEGLEDFFSPGDEVIVAHSTDEAIDAIGASESELQKLAAAARERTLSSHTAAHRAMELENILLSTRSTTSV